MKMFYVTILNNVWYILEQASKMLEKLMVANFLNLGG